MRFPTDGLILWDRLKALDIHNRIRALTNPFPCAYTYFGKIKLKLISSKLQSNKFYGEPGRIYKIGNNKILVCALDRCLWITAIEDYYNGKNYLTILNRYEQFVTANGIVKEFYDNK